MLRLYTFASSHFAERARWTLDLNRFEYTERRLIPGLHMLVIRRRVAGTSVPLLEHDKTFVQGSGAIADYLEQRLGATRLAPSPGASDRCAQIEELAERVFGAGGTRIFYATMLNHRNTLVDLWTHDGPPWTRALYALSFPVAVRATRRMYGINATAVHDAKDAFRRAVDTIDRALESSPYILGDTLSRADVTVASLLALMCRPLDHPFQFPTAAPPELARFVAEFEGRPTWDFVRRMYTEHRRRRDPA